MNYKIRQARIDDCEIILTLIKELASYEQLADEVTGSVADLRSSLFGDRRSAEVLILEEENIIIGFALFFHNYSSFLCRYGIYIEDIYIRESYRGRGYGKAFFQHICAIAKQRQCGRVEWWCLDENKPAIDFYIKLGAESMSDWTVYRLNSDKIIALSAISNSNDKE